jgi:regulator of CtrA degradation
LDRNWTIESHSSVQPGALHHALVQSLYGDALILADEARSWFDRARAESEDGDVGDTEVGATGTPPPRSPFLPMHAPTLAVVGNGEPASSHKRPADPDSIVHWHGRHDQTLRIALSCESLRLTTRLMHVIAWLLFQRAIAAGEVDASAALLCDNRLGESPPVDHAAITALPAPAVRLIEASERLYARAAQLQRSLIAGQAAPRPPVHGMLERLIATY